MALLRSRRTAARTAAAVLAAPTAAAGDVTLTYGEARTVDAVTVAAAFGQGQGPTSVSVEANPGCVRQQVMPAAPVTWSSNSGTVETRTLALPGAVTATRFRIVVRAADNTWGHVGLNGIALHS